MARLEIDVRLRYPSGVEISQAFTSERLLTAVVGPSGSGKTSLLSMIAGLRRPDEGRIVVDQQVYCDSQKGIHLAPELRQVGYVFQDYLLFPHLTVRDNLTFGAKRAKARKSSIQLDDLVQVLELGDLLDRFPEALSGGQRQRVSVGRALLSRPRLLLLDEPFASVHEELKQNLLRWLIDTVTQLDIPVVYVTHDPHDLQGVEKEIITISNSL